MKTDIREAAARAAEKRAKMMQEEAGGREVAYSLSDYSDGYLAGYEAALWDFARQYHPEWIKVSESLDKRAGLDAAKAEGGELPGAEVVRGLHWRVS